ncbi:hypothetical protein [Dactylosporangium roseum]|nr:hypothetical protein [Dactylosporangium roseum]
MSEPDDLRRLKADVRVELRLAEPRRRGSRSPYRLSARSRTDG